jgi:CRISPR system Cascade subunit CasC
VFVELHVLQNFAPSNLNRDDTGAPKDCEFGGYRRARISSQCLKRAIRRDAGFGDFLAARGGVRTRRLIMEIAERLSGERPAPERDVKLVADVFREGGIERPAVRRGGQEERDATKLILFLGAPSIDAMVARFRQELDGLRGGSKESRAKVVRELGALLADTVKVPDIALFGRMIEIDPEKPFGKLGLRVDAACQVAHAISTHRVNAEFDFFTAVDELEQPGEKLGASMLGTVEFNSACYYRYANVHLGQLVDNLGGDAELAQRTLEAFLLASVHAVPSGKQHSMAAQNPPSFVLAVARDRGLWSLANAFVKPIRPSRDGDLVGRSVHALDAEWGTLNRMYGSGGLAGTWALVADSNGLDHLSGASVDNLDALVAGVSATAFGPAQPGTVA